MKKKTASWLFVIAFLVTAGCEEKPGDVTTFILVRHAEKVNDGTDDPDLTSEGQSRAMRLAFMLRDTPLQAIYSTGFRRTQNTAKPIADMKNMEVLPYEADKPEEISKMLQQHKGGIVLMTGHSNNIPWTANLLLGREVFKDYPESQYGTILIVSVGKTNEGSSVVRLNY